MGLLITFFVFTGGYIPWIIGHNLSCGKNYSQCVDCEGNPEMSVTFLTFKRCPALDFEWGAGGVGYVTCCPGCGRPDLNWASI